MREPLYPMEINPLTFISSRMFHYKRVSYCLQLRTCY